MDSYNLAVALSVMCAMEEDMSEWVKHDGFSDPRIPGDTNVEIERRDGERCVGRMHDWDQAWQWQDTEDGFDAPGAIVSYRIIKSGED